MSPWPAIAAAAGLVLLASQRAQLLELADPAPVALDLADGTAAAEVGQGGTALEVAGFLSTFDLAADAMPAPADSDLNLRAFLSMIRRAEGTADGNGYRRIFGGQLFDDYADHPRVAVPFTDQRGRRLYSSAAGAYQFCAVSPLPGGGSTKVDTWDRMARRLALPDFGPVSQDRAALQLIDDCGATGLVQAGRLPEAVAAVRKVWASMPGAGYAQPEKTLAYLRDVYTAAGGSLA